MESQNTEWKLKWSDDYLKWICGFANAQGGSIYIGCDDSGKVVGCPHCRKLLEDIPNKVRDVLGILVDVDLLNENGLEYLCIRVKPSLFPVNCRGEYHYRSGSTKQQLQGGALTQFLMQRMGSTFYWDSAPVQDVSPDELDRESFELFRRGAIRSGRMAEENLALSREELLRGLGLMPDGHLTRAAVLLFHHTPERWFPGAYAKIAFFPNDADIAYMDEIHGSLFEQAERIIELLYLKYMKATVTYDNINRVETYPFPRTAVREAVLNALIHTCYASGVPMQIRVYEDKLYISNSTITMDGWTMERYVSEHRSEPYNPSIAGTFFRAGLVESWGRGIEKICRTCTEGGGTAPSFEGRPNAFMVCFSRAGAHTTRPDSPVPALQVANLTRVEQEVLQSIRENPSTTQAELARKLGYSPAYIFKTVAKLKKRNILTRDGAKKTGRWLISVIPSA